MTTATTDTPLVPIDIRLAEHSRVLVISTSHVTAETAARFDDAPQWGPSCLTWDYGWMVYAASPDDDWSDDAPELLHILRSAEASGFDWVQFDSDGDTLDAFPTWEW
jgi:hypothetical protein